MKTSLSRDFIRTIFVFIFLLTLRHFASGQGDLVTYAGNTGKETFYDVTQLSDGTFLVCGYAENLDWLSNSNLVELSYSSAIPNALGTNRYGLMLHLSNDLQTILEVIHFPQGAVEDIRFIKTNSLPYETTGDLYISCTTADSDANNGGYVIAKLNGNFIETIPTGLDWVQVVWAKTGPRDYHPWDVTSDGRVYYVSGEAHGYDWSAMYCLDQSGQRMPVEHWRTHWLTAGGEWKGTPASDCPNGGADAINYSGIVFKIGGRCELRSWTEEDYNLTLADGNGGTKQGRWPADFLFSGPCDPASPTADGPGYSGYSAESCCPVWGASSICVDRRDNHVYLGMNFKSYFNPESTPDFEPAVIAFGDEGEMKWWSRLYHEITPQDDTVGSIPDQYVDALAIDYANDQLVVGARCHGNNTENLWEGNEIAANPNAHGFQNRFTGTQGDIHISWLGKLTLDEGTLMHSTYMAEYSEGTGSLGTPHPDPNLDGWPDPNTGWPNVNSTRMAKNALETTSSGDVVVGALGRRTITTANAYQKMVLPEFGGQSAWNSFIRVYNSDLGYPKYSSLVVGEWDTLTQAGGGNTEMFGLYKTTSGVIAVGKHTADNVGLANGNPIPVNNVPAWGAAIPENESAILVYYKADNLINPNDSVQANSVVSTFQEKPRLEIFPNPATDRMQVVFDRSAFAGVCHYAIYTSHGSLVKSGILDRSTIEVSQLENGLYELVIWSDHAKRQASFVVLR